MKLRALSAFAMSMALAAGLSGCAGSAGEGANAGGNGGTSQDSTGSLTIAKPDGPITTQNNNPFVSDGSAARLSYSNVIYEPLAVVNLIDPSSEPEPWLAEELKWNDDYTSIELTARDGVKWNDGEDFTAEDIGFTFDLVKKTPALDTANLGIKDVKVEGDTVTVNFEKSVFVKTDKVLQRQIVPKHVWESVGDPVKYDNKEPVGTGPYTLSKFTSQSVELTARDDYWKGTPAVATLYYVSYNDNTALTNALASGDADWAQAFIPNVESAYLSKDKEHNKYWAPAGLGIDTMFVNTTTKPFNDVALRQAMNKVIDRAKHAEIAREGSVPALTSVTGLPTPAGDAFISDSYKGEEYKVDVDGAKAVLQDAGYTWDGSGKLIDPAGETVAFKLSVPQGWNDYVTGISLIADAAKAIGVEATLNTPDSDTWWDAKSKGEFQAILHWTDTGVTPYDIYSDTMDGRWLKPAGEAADFNFGRYKSEKATKALDEYATSSSDEARTAALAKAQQTFVEEVPSLPIGTRPFIGVYNTRVFEGWPSEDDPYAVPDPTNPAVVLVLSKLKAA
ncbi:ABC transporter substrate-binding protein [uncultured Tessaracoccus sp.]|uniref:ABC transporter substrate-binding protein n=1 Tax=uncultured Tessaracoccus sp. TaxID=905023 RepID=UPI0025DDFE66|nr:ABC transporter substrate-binding protein [uncultured Tessaracoccus sp.]